MKKLCCFEYPYRAATILKWYKDVKQKMGDREKWGRVVIGRVVAKAILSAGSEPITECEGDKIIESSVCVLTGGTCEWGSTRRPF